MKNAKKLQILVIDDEEDTLELIRLVLKQKRYNVTTAKTWVEVVECTRGKLLANEKYDAIILDLMLPGRSGFEIYKDLLALMDPLPPVIVLSAITDIRTQIKAREMGVAKYLTKPTQSAKLIDTIKEVMGKS